MTMTDPRTACVQHPRIRALSASADPATDRDAILAHAADCADCGKFLQRHAPDLLLAAFNLDLPIAPPLDARELLPKLPPRQSWRWPAAAAALLVAGLSFAVFRVADPVGRVGRVDRVGRVVRAENPQPAKVASAAAHVPPEFLAMSAVISSEPVIESGADDFSVSEYDAAGFDGQPARWVRLRSESGDAAPMLSAQTAPGAARS